MNIKTLKNKLENAVKDIIKTFEEKQEVSFEFFVGDDCLENKNKTINYNSYCMGLRFEDVKENKLKVEVNKSTIESNNAELLLCEVKDYLENTK